MIAAVDRLMFPDVALAVAVICGWKGIGQLVLAVRLWRGHR